MAIIKGKFTPTVNIIRDENKEINYISTPNSESVFQQLTNHFRSGVHSFNIIGSYGTGKSSFLWAFERHLVNKRNIFKSGPDSFNNVKKYRLIKIIGDYESFTSTFANIIGSKNESEGVIKRLKELYKDCLEENSFLLILVDEFGKFLEFAAKNSPEKELYLVQRIAEFVNDTDKKIIFVTILHQNFSAYTLGLNKNQRIEWEKVKGRFHEIAFNEPVEQLLYLASAYLGNEIRVDDKPNQYNLIQKINESRLFSLNIDMLKNISRDLYPLDVLAAAVITKALQKYGQNDRSLFSFLNLEGDHGVKKFKINKGQFFNLVSVYNYLIHNFYSFLFTKYNPDYLKWISIRNAVERAGSIFDEDFKQASAIIITIGLLNIFTSKGASISNSFLKYYVQKYQQIANPEKIIRKLRDKQIIRYRDFQNTFILFEGTDLDLESELLWAESKIDIPLDITPQLKEYFDFPLIMAKSVYYKTGTPRFFEIKLTKEPFQGTLSREIDGIVNLIFNPNVNTESIVDISSKNGEAVLFGFCQKTVEIRNIVCELEKIKLVMTTNQDDAVVRRELKQTIQFLSNELHRALMRDIYDGSSFEWIFNGRPISIKSQRDFSNFLSIICEKIYYNTPIFINELINRNKLSSSISSAKKSFMNSMILNWRKKDFGFQDGKFPPEKTIYLSLLRQTGIHRELETSMVFSKPSEKTFEPLWNVCDNFFIKSKGISKNVSDLVDTLLEKPFKLKSGFLEFWIPIFFFIKKDDYLLFYNDIFIPELTSEILQMLVKHPEKFKVRSFIIKGKKVDVFNKYRKLVKKSTSRRLSNSLFIETIKPLLLFFNSIPDFTKSTNALSKDAMNVREVISTTKDPERIFFEELPNALGYPLNLLITSETKLKEFFQKLETAIREIEDFYPKFLYRFENKLLQDLGLHHLKYDEYISEIRQRYHSLKEYQLTPHQKSFYSRLLSKVEERESWLQSVIYGLVGIPADQMDDKSEALIYEKMSGLVYELDNLCSFEKLGVDNRHEELIQFEIMSPGENRQKRVVRMSKAEAKNAGKKTESILQQLSSNRKENMFILLSLLKTQLEDEKN